jgi:SAM-dependent methyltransferase
VSQATERFSSRVANYIKYRPGYPPAIVDLLIAECGLTPQSVIADIGSGTGKLTELFLANGYKVFGVEPNAAMREAGEDLLRNFPRFESVNGSAEGTTLPANSVDIVTAGQAFHWFDPYRAKVECTRILKPAGWAVLVWNDRQLETTPFLTDYELFLQEFGTDYNEIRNDKSDAPIQAFFSPDKINCRSFPNHQLFDYDGLRGRVLSSSYIPEPQHPEFETMLRRLEQIFLKHARDGWISFDYETKVYFGHLSNDQQMR